MRRLLIIVFCFCFSPVCFSPVCFSELLLRANSNVNFVYEKPSIQSKLLGRVPKDSEVRVVPGFEAGDESFYRVFVQNSKNETLVGFVEQKNFVVVRTRSDSYQDSKNEQVGKWALGLGLSGVSTDNQTRVLLGIEGRYQWNPVIENALGLDFTFGGSTLLLGSKFLTRAYAPLPSFKPFLQAGIAMSDLSEVPSSGAWILGFGFQITRPGGAYFELGADYFLRETFNSMAKDAWIFGGSSGFRF